MIRRVKQECYRHFLPGRKLLTKFTFAFCAAASNAVTEREMKQTFFSLSYVVVIFLALIPVSRADTVLMSADWGKAACDAWNADSVLTDGLATSGWVANNDGRGHKLLHVYRSDCADSPSVELRIADEGTKAHCVYGGAVQNALDLDVDYLMHAKTGRWIEMGNGDYGPMWAMMSFKLKFKGPKMEAMNNMEPFEAFLLLVGKVPSAAGACP